MYVTEKQRGNSGETRIKHQFKNMNELTDTVRQRILYLLPNQECKEKKQDISNIPAKMTNLNNITSPLRALALLVTDEEPARFRAKDTA